MEIECINKIICMINLDGKNPDFLKFGLKKILIGVIVGLTSF